MYIYNIYNYIHTVCYIDINRIVTGAMFIACLFACDACRMILYDVVFVEACQRNASMSDGMELVGSLRRMIPQVFGQWTVCLVGSCHICWTLFSEGWHFATATLSNSWPNLCRWLLYIVSMQRLLRWIRRNSAHMSWLRPWDGPRLERDNRSEGVRVLPCSACRLQTVPSMRI